MATPETTTTTTTTTAAVPFRKISPYISYTPKYIEITADPNYTGADITFFENVKHDTIWTLAERKAKEHGEYPFLGTRQYDKEKKVFTDYKFITYGEGIELAAQYASGLVELGLKKGDIVSECFKNRAEWIINDLALFRQGAVASPLRSELDNTYYEHIVIATNPKFAVIAPEKLEDILDLCSKFQKAERAISFKVVVVMPYPTGPRYGDATISAEQAERAKAFGVCLVPWEEVMSLGKAHPHEAVEADPMALHSILFTSGTTSNQPKGVLLRQRGFICHSCRHSQYVRPMLYSYIHMAHVGERGLVSDAIGIQAAIGFPSGTVLTMLDDLEVLHPTLICAAPIVLKTFQNKAFELIRSGVDEKTASAIFRKKFGGCCEFCICSGAPCAEELSNWVTKFLDMNFSSAYGLTEAAGTLFLTPNSKIASPFGCIGQPCPLVTARIIDAPELGYCIKDDPPCGELIVRNPSTMVGYLDNPEKTAAAIDEEGFLHTNDIVRLNDDGTLTVIDRRDNMMKTACAAYIPAEQVESIISTSPLVSQAWVYGRKSDTFIVAVIVPNFGCLVTDPRLPAALKEQAAAAAKNPSSEAAAAICSNEEVNKIFMEDIARLGVENHFPYYWDIKGVLLESCRWTEENGCLTFTNKIRRRALTEKYQDRLDKLMTELKEKVQLKYC